jgi:REP element-mobilizing transposase RayT
VELDEFVIMPNHVHGIIIIVGAIHVGAIHVGAIHESPLQHEQQHSTITRRKMLLPKIIGFYKMNSPKQINQIRQMPGTPIWQRNYYEHIIRSESELNRVGVQNLEPQHIINNPLQWQYDVWAIDESPRQQKTAKK